MEKQKTWRRGGPAYALSRQMGAYAICTFRIGAYSIRPLYDSLNNTKHKIDKSSKLKANEIDTLTNQNLETYYLLYAL